MQHSSDADTDDWQEAYLARDANPPNDGELQYAVVSCVPRGGSGSRAARNQPRDFIIKIHGAFDNTIEAEALMNARARECPQVSVYVAEMYRPLIMPPPRELDKLVDTQYHDERLNDIMQANARYRREEKRVFDKRFAAAKAKSKSQKPKQ